MCEGSVVVEGAKARSNSVPSAASASMKGLVARS
jgi:hypothetical protein